MACVFGGMARDRVVRSVCLFLCFSIFHPASAIDGTVTLYGGPQDGGNPNVASNGVLDGSCGYGALDQSEWPNWMAAAIGPSNPLTSGGNPGGCGACVQVTCTSGCSSTASPATVLITDTCPSCAPTQINVQALTFQKYFQSNLALGQVQATWQQVPCSPPGNIEIVVSNSRSTLGGYLVLTLQQVAGTGRISSVEFQASGSQGFTPMTNFFGNAYQISNFGAPPFSLRITGQGQTLIASNAITAVQDGKYPTQIQFGRSSTTAQGPPPASLPPAPPPVVPLAPPPLAQSPPPAPPPAQTPIRTAPPPVTPVPTPQATPAPTPAVPAPSPSPPLTTVRVPISSPVPASNATRNATSPSPSLALSPAPSSSNLTAPAPSTGIVQRNISSSPAPSNQSTALAPGEITLSVNSGLTGEEANAANQVVNPAISVSAGRRLTSFTLHEES